MSGILQGESSRQEFNLKENTWLDMTSSLQVIPFLLREVGYVF